MLVETTLDGAVTVGQTVVTLTDATGIAIGNEIGFYNATEKRFGWRTVSGVAGNNVTVSVAIAAEFPDGAPIRSYASSTAKPLKISDATLQLDTSSETVIVPVSQREWRELSVKTSDGNPSQFFYKPTISEGELYIWPQVDDELKYINLVVEQPFDDFDTSTDNPAAPSEYYQIIIYTLAHRLAIQYGFLTRSNLLKQQLQEYWVDMQIWDHQEASMSIEFNTPIIGGY